MNSQLEEINIVRITKQLLTLNNKKISLKSLHKITYYVAQYEDSVGNTLFKRTVKSQIKSALRQSKSKFTFDEIVEMFRLEETYLNRQLTNLSHNKWIYSCAVGFAKGKKIFCFPWLAERELKCQTYRFGVLAKIVKENDMIMLIPVENDKSFLNNENEDDIKFDYKKLLLD